MSVSRQAALLSLLFVAALSSFGPAGCVRGDRLVSDSHAAYNEAIRDRLDEELLLNLVRLRYRDRPLFLRVSSVVANFQRNLGGGLGAQAGLDNSTPGDPDSVDSWGNLSVSFGYAERPTVTFTPLQGEEFAERLLRPIDLQTLALLQRSGWSIERVLRLMVQRMNGLDNAASASGPTPASAPGYRRFAEAARALRVLQSVHAVVIGSETSDATLGVPIPAERLLPADLLAAAEAGHHFEQSEDGEQVVLRSTANRFVLRIAAAQQSADAMQQFRQVLGLHPERRSFDLIPAAGDVDDVLGAPGQRERIVMVTRSLLGTLFFLCHAVEVPAAHETTGVVTVTTGEGDQLFSWTEVTNGLLTIHSSIREPESAAIAVPYRGYWFYISDDDLTSKSTFTLLSQLYALQAGDPSTGSAPVPTIPIGG